MTFPRPYVAAAAASVLAALYFVPSASASPSHAPVRTTTSHAAATTAQAGDLADTGAIDTTPYVVGGAAFLLAGAGLVFNARRRSRQEPDLDLEAPVLDV